MTMHHHPDLSLAQQYAAARAWWHDAGVDLLFEDEPQAMLREPEAEAPKPVRAALPVAEVVAAPAPPVFAAANLPQTLADFAEWWCDPATPLPGTGAPRIAPRGKAGAKLMVLAPMPEAGDSAELFSGSQGRMLSAMLKALEVDPASAYFAAALPSPMTTPDWDGFAASGLGTVLAHHIALARPERVLLLGSPLARMLPGEPAIPTLASYAPDQLIDHPRQRARLWHRLLEWMPEA